jgi:hypothetical protein
MANLNQMGTALASYTGDYGDYFPSNPSWQPYFWNGAISVQRVGASANGYAHDRGWFKHPQDGNGVFAVSTTGYSPNTWAPTFGYYWSPFSLHTIAFGGCSNVSTASTTFRQRQGDLNAGPLGLGGLVVSGYMGDARSFYCPSGEGLPKLSQGYWGGAVTLLRDYKTLGGFSARDLTHGDYRTVLTQKLTGTWQDTNGYPAGGLINSHVMSHYAYRGMPLDNPDITDPDQNTPPTTVIDYYPGVNPVIRMDMANNWQNVLGRPVFKTARALGGRAIASDFFGRWNEPTVAVSVEWRTGGGLWMHRDGYNVLYGDASARWYGDPQQRIIWQARAKYLSSVGAAIGSYHWLANGYQLLWYDPHANNGFLVWHLFDEAAGIDVGVLK